MDRFNCTRLGLGVFIFAALLSLVRPAAATDFDGSLELMGGGYNATNFTKVEDTSTFIWWRLIRQVNPSATGSQWHKMRETGNWSRQFGAYGGTTINPADNFVISTTVDAGDSGWSPSDWGAPGDINIDVQNSKSYVFNFTDNQGYVVAPGNDIGVFTVIEVSHQNALVQFGAELRTTQTAQRVYLNSNSSAESSGSNEEIWFQWTTNDFSTKTFVEISSVATNTTLELVVTNDVRPGAELKWLVMTTVATDTSTVSGTSSGVNNFDAVAIYKSAVQTWFVRPSYRGEIVDEFMYSSGATLNNSTNGNGWTNGWVESNAGAFTASAGSFGNVTGYPTNLGNKITVNPAGGTTRTARRGFPAVTHGRLYVAYHFNHTTSGTDRWAGLALMDGTTERAFVGETFTGNQLLGVTVTNGTINSAYGLTAGVGNDYTIIGYYDFLRGEFRAKAYYKTDTIPTGEPTTWDVTYVLGSGITRIDGIQLTAGGTGAATPGATFFDEVRVGHSWGDIVMQPTFQWDAGGGATDRDWSTAVNWSDNREPIATNNAFIGFSMTGVVSQAGELAADLFIGNTNNGTLLQTAGSLTVTNFTLGHAAGGAGVYEMSGGAMTARVNMIVGASGAGTAIVHGASSVVAVQGNIHIGMSNSINRAVFQHNAGTVTAVTVSIGELSGTEGRYTMTGGALSASTQIYMGNGNVNSTGRFEITGGRVDAPNIFVGRNGLGLMTVGGAATVSVNGVNADIVIGDLSSNNRTNTLFVNGGAVGVGDNIELGNAANSFGRMIMSGGSMIVTGQVLVGDNASSTGDVVVSGGMVRTDESLLIGSLGLGQFAMHGGSWTSTFIRLSDAIGGSTLLVGNGVLAAQGTGDFEIDFSGTATVTGGVLQAHDFDLGIQPGALARLNVSGGTVLASNLFNIGFASGATGIVELTGGAVTVKTTGATTEIGTTIGSHGYLILSNGNFTTEDHVRLGTAGGTGTGVLHVIGGGSSILVGDSTTEDFTMGSQAADLRVTFIGASLSPIRVQDDLVLAGNLTISNIGTVAAGTYVIATSLNGSAISGAFAYTNWMGSVTGTISYANAAVTLTVALPVEIGVLGTNFAEITDGDVTPSVADGTDYGAVHVSGAFVERTFQITNAGNSVLTISSVTTSGTHAADFSVQSFPTTVSGNSASNLVIRFDPSALGTRTATITIANDDSDEASYDFALQGTGVAANVAVLGLSSTEIADGDTTPSTGDGTDFGTVGLVGSTLVRTFTITNTGNTALGFGTVSVSGTHAADFTVTTQPSGSPINPGATTTFQVTFDPSAIGLRTASLSFTNTAGFYSKDPYNFDIQGTGAGAGISNRPGSFTVSTMMGQNPADVTFSITNVGLGTLNYTLTTNNGAWLTARPGSAALAAGAGQMVTVSVSVVGLNAGTSNATINVIDASATNSPQTVTYALTITNVPGATAVSATPEGAEMVRLAWTKPTGYDVMIVHRATNAPAAPAQATAYAVGDDIGGGSRVIYKGGTGSLEHIVLPGSTNHYAFYGFTGNNYYSPVTAVSATAGVYRAGEIVEQGGYTNGVNLSGRSGGQGWTNGWTTSGSGTWQIQTNYSDAGADVPRMTTIAGYPAVAGNRMKIDGLASDNTAFASRYFAGRTSGEIYVAAMMSFRYDGGAGALSRYYGISLYDGATEEAFIGRAGGNDKLAIDATGSTKTESGYVISGTEGGDTGNVYLVIAKYDFAANRVYAKTYYRTDTVPVIEPAWDITNAPSPAIARVDGIRIGGGAYSGNNIGSMWFDEVRVATNWVELMGRSPSYPFVTNLAVNGGSNVTDAQMTSGVFNVVAHIRDTAGVETTNTISPMFIPNFDLLSNDGTPVQLVTDRVFQTFGRIDGGLTVVATSTTHATIPVSEVVLGVHTVRVSAANSNGLTTVDVRTNSAGATLAFTVVDDDTTAPVIGTFVGQGRALASAIYTNTEFTGGFWVTGTVTDAGSGLFAASNTFTLTRNGVSLSNGIFAVNFANGGATAGGNASNNFPQVDMLAGAYTLTVFAVDFDIDRTADQLQSSATFSFTVVEPPAAPGLAVAPLTLTYNAMLGSSPAAQTFAVTNVGVGTLNYTNYQTYGPGASGWFSADLTNHALIAAASRIHTGRVSSATFNAIGAYIATNRVDGNQTNAAQEIVVTLNVTNIPSPTAASATPSGAEHVALRATESSGRQILIVHRETNAPSADPVNGTPYSVGGSIGGGTVIYKGAAGYLDHVVRVGSTNFYALYTINNDRYSTSVVLGATVTVYRAGEIVEPFSYTNGVALTGLNGGSGFTNVWTTNSALASANQFIVSTQQFTTISGYPAAAGNSVTSQNAGVFRSFAPVSSGRIYVSFMMRTDNGGGSQYSGMSFYSDGTEEKFVGEGFSQVNQLTVGAATGPTGHQLANNTDYTIIARYDYDTDVFSALLYTNGTETVPTFEPATWDVTEADATVGNINRIRLESNVGVRWDEVRVATSWEDLFDRNATYEWDAGAGSGNRSWSTAANWTRDTEPGIGNSAFINNAYTGVVSAAGERAGELHVGSTNMPSNGLNFTGRLEQIGGDLVIGTNMYLGRWMGAIGAFVTTNGSLSVSNNLLVGDHGRGLMTVTGAASVWVGSDLSVGNSSAASETNGSTLTIGGGSVFVGDELRLGGTGGSGAGADGTVNMFGGLLQVTNAVIIGDHGSSTGLFVLAGGRLNALGELVIVDSASGQGLFRQGGGTADVAGIIRIGDSTTSDSQLIVSGGVFNAANTINVGDNSAARGSVTISGGVFNANGSFDVGFTANSTGTLTVAAGILNAPSGIRIGVSGAGSMTLSGGSVTSDTFRLADLAGSTGSLTVTGGRLAVTNTSTTAFILDQDNPIMTQSGGTVEITGGMELGDVAGAQGTIFLSGGTLIVGGGAGASQDLQLGDTAGGTGVVYLTGGFLDLNRSGIDLRLGDANPSRGIFAMNVGTALVGNIIYVGSAASAAGELYVTGGVLEAVSDLLLASGTDSTGRVVQSGGRVAAGGNIEVTTSTGANGYYEISGGTLTNAGSLTVGRTDALGTGVFHIVGSTPVIHVGDSTTEDFRIQNSGELRLTFSGSAIAPVRVSDDIVLSAGSTLTITNIGAVNPGSYLVATSLNGSAVSGTFSATNWLGGYTGTVTYANNRILVTFDLPPEIAVLGTNFAVIASGDATPAVGDGTDFGEVSVGGGLLDRTFYITNSGTLNLGVTSVVTSGPAASDFIVVSWPAIVGPTSASNLVVRFDPSAVGTRVATITVNNADSDEGVYTFAVQGTGAAPNLVVAPLTLSFSAMLGSSPAATQTITVSNDTSVGTLIYTNFQTYGPGASGWLNLNFTNFSIGPAASRIHTALVSSATFTAAGTYTATNRVDGNQTNAAQLVVVTLTVTNIPTPTSVTAAPDGAELVRLTAAEASGRQILVVHSYTNTLTVQPTNGSAYAVGDLLGNGRVVFKFTGSAATTNLEHVVAQGSTNFYSVYAINNDRYSTSAVVGATTTVYRAGERVDQFAYTNGVSANGLGGGQGWTNNWTATGPNIAADIVITNNNFMNSFMADWPTRRANVLVLKTTNNSTYAARRNFAGITSGKVYVAAEYRRAFDEGPTDGKFSGIRLVDGTTEVAYFGERGGSGNEDIFGVSSSASATYGANDSFGPSTNFLIIARYDFDTDVFSALYYTTNNTVPAAEPSFFVSVTNASITRIDGVQLVAGADSGWPGDVRFDEVRVAATWIELIGGLATYPEVTNLLVNGGSDVTDAQLTSGVFNVVAHIRDTAGVEVTNTVSPFFIPNFDILSNDGTPVQLVTDRVFQTFGFLSGGQTVVATSTTHATVPFSETVLGVYTVRVSAANSNGLTTIDVRTNTAGATLTFTVVDDDTAAPTTMNINSPESGASRAMHVSTASVAVAAVGGTSGTNITYRISDAWLATGVSGGSPLVFYFGARDAGSGLSRGTSDAASQSSLTIGSAVISNVAQWSSTLSSSFADTLGATATNAWSFTSAFSASQIENLVTNATWGSAGSNRVTLTWRDADNDRANDRSTLENEQHGWIGVFDDDTTPPTIQNVRIFGAQGSYTVRVDELTSGSGWAITGRVSDADSGVNVNGSVSNQPNNSPYFELWDSVGTLRFRKAFDTLGFVDGGATTLSSISNGASVVSGVTFADVGVWTARVIVADNDEDYGNNDHAIGTNEVSFNVVLGATLGGISRYPASFAVTSSFGTVTSTNPWPQFFVTNIGSGTLNYSATISYSGAGGWLTVAPTSGVLIGTGSSAIHTNTVDASSLSPGTYSATITLNGDQTNAAQTITVNLRVFGYYPGEIVDQFTNSTGTLHTNIGGTGWAGTWSNNPNTGFSYDSGNLTIPGNYPAAAGNKVCGNTASDTELQTFRTFGTTFTTGELFMAVAVRKSDGNADGFNGISFMSNGTEVAFAGKLFGSGSFGIDLLANGGSVASAFGVNGAGDPGYFYIGKYDFETDIFYGRAYNNSDSLPLTEPSTWSATNTPTTPIGAINGIRIAARNEGTFCFDELRVSPTWEGLLNLFTNEPNVHASGINFRDVTTNAMIVGWTPGNGANRIVIAREGAAVTFSPTDSVAQAFNNDYTLGTDLGAGNKVVYNGGGTNFTLTGLTETTRYFFAIYEYNGSPPNYYTNAGFATGSRWTLASEPASNATAFAAYTVSDSSISNTWTAADGSPAADGYLILRSFGAVTSLPADGVAYTNGQIVGASVASVVTPGSAVTYLHTGLTSCSNYHFRIFSFRWNGSADETYNYRTNFTQTATAETECVAPTVQASNIVFSLTGTNRISLSWQRGNGQGNLLVVRGTNAVSADPADGTTYTANLNYGSGSHLGDGNYVVLIGTGTTATVTGLVPSVTYHFRVYEYNGSGSGIDYNTNTAVNNPRSTATASIGLVYEPFDYGSFENMGGKSGGTGWTNNWSTAGGLVETGAGDYPDFGAYPPDTPAPTRSGFIDLGNAFEDVSGQRSATRYFPAFNSGKFYMAFKINDNHSMGTSDFLGIDLLNGAGVTGFVGKASGVADRRLTVAHNGATRTNRLDGSNSGYQLNASTDYLIVMKYDFNTKEFDAAAYISSNLAHADPDLELGWVVQMTNVHISRIDGIRLVASDNNQIVTFDSIRIGPSWEEVMWDLPDNWHEDNGPVPTLVYIGTNYGPSVYSSVITNLSDAELQSSTLIDFAVRWDSPSGIFITNATATNYNIGSPNARVSPNWDPLAVGVASNLFNLDKFFTNFFGVNGSTVITTYQKNGFSVTNIDFSLQYFVTVSAETFPGGTTVAAPNGASWDAVPVTRALTVNEPLRFYVYDDDTNAPALGARPLRIFTNATIASAQDAGGGLERYFVYDGMITQSGMRVQLNTYDTYSGLQRSSSGSAASNLNVTIPFVVTNDNASYDAALSSADSTVSASTSTWAFASSLFTWDRVSAMWGGDGTALQGQDVEVRANLPDADEDRLDDQMWSSNTVMGYIRLLDDDITAPNTPDIDFAGSASRPFFMNTNGYAIGSGDTEIRNTYARRSGTGSNSVFAITDEELAQAGSRQLQFVFGALDADTGVRRGASGTTNTIMSFSLGDGILSGVTTGWNASTSTTVNAPGVVQTNVWMFTNGFFTETVITQLLAVTGSSGSGSNRVAVTIPDADDDRTNDVATTYSRTVGWLQVFDDDINGPVMSVADVVEASGGAAILSTSFETNQMWPVPSTSSTITWTNTDSYGSWILQGVTHTSLDPKNTGTRRLGMLTNTFAQPYFQLPPVSNPGRVTLYAARVSGGSGTPVLRLEWRNGVSWDSLGNNNVTNTVYEPLTWDFEILSAGVTLRVVRVDTGTSRSQVYVDDVSVNSTLEWIGTNAVTNSQIRINWTAAVDDFSGIEDYHIVPPAMNSVAPMTTNDGNPISAAFTTTVQSIAGQQGVITGFIFSVDDDTDRSNDRSMGNVLPVLVKVDTNPPPAVLSVTNLIDDPAVDETSELKFQWTPFSTNMHAAAGWRQSDSEPLSHWDTYYITVHELDGSFNEVSTNVITATNGPSVLATNVTTSIVVSNLTFDTFYRIRVAGRDRAGNIGPAMISTGLTVNFQVTQGLARTTTEITNGIRLAWIASSNRVYDQLYVDATSFRDTLSNQWDWVDRITNNVAEGNTLTDVGGDNPTNRYRVPPASLSNTMRFYRVSLQDAWQPTNTLRRGSREVYVTKPLSLVPGENWYSVFFAPDTATVSYVFGTNRLWGGSSYAQATKIHWFSPTNAGSSYNYATNTIWLAGTNGYGGTWTYDVGGVGNANNMVFPTHQGFMIEVPPGSPNISLPIVGQVMTQQTTTVIGGGTSQTNTYHIVSWRYPTRVSLTGALFRGSGMVGNNVSVLADEVRILRNNGNGSLEQPEARWRLRSDQTTWQLISYNTNVYAAPGPDVNTFFIEPDDAVIIVRKNPGTMNWTNRVYYTPPGKNFNP